MPASATNVNLCKTLLSAAVLGYPAPTLVNFEKKFDDANLIFGGTHLAKIGGILDYLKALPSEYDNDIVLIVDGYDVWFQLRPHVLLQRYFDIVRGQKNDPSNRMRGRAAFEQKIIFSSQKRCWPKEAKHPACWAVPQSTLPSDIYGSLTDTDTDDPVNPYLKYRPRYLNSGSIIGPIYLLKPMFERARAKAERSPGIGSDQNIFAEIFGEQEFMRMKQLDEEGQLTEPLQQLISANNFTVVPAADRSQNFEFGIGIDYNMTLVQATVFSEDDTAWIRRGKREDLLVAMDDLNIEKMPVLSHSNDFETLYDTGPLTPYAPYVDELKLSDWTNVPLFTDIWTGVSPVAIHHNAHHHGLKARREEHWNRTWYQPHLRALLDARIFAPVLPLAILEQDGQMKEFWSNIVSNSGAEVGTTAFKTWEELCNSENIVNEIFRDGQGLWKSPMPRPKLFQ